MKETISYTDVASLTVTSGSDGFIIVRMPVDGPQAKVRAACASALYAGLLHVLLHICYNVNYNCIH